MPQAHHCSCQRVCCTHHAISFHAYLLFFVLLVWGNLYPNLHKVGKCCTQKISNQHWIWKKALRKCCLYSLSIFLKSSLSHGFCKLTVLYTIDQSPYFFNCPAYFPILFGYGFCLVILAGKAHTWSLKNIFPAYFHFCPCQKLLSHDFFKHPNQCTLIY